MADVRAIGHAPHPTGSFGNAAVRTYLIARLDSMGLEVATISGRMSAQAKRRLDGWRQTAAPAPPLTDIVAILPGRDRALPAVRCGSGCRQGLRANWSKPQTQRAQMRWLHRGTRPRASALAVCLARGP